MCVLVVEMLASVFELTGVTTRDTVTGPYVVPHAWSDPTAG